MDHEEMTSESACVSSAGPRVLIVEDDPDQRELICEAMRIHFADRQGSKIVGVGTGADCLAQQLHDFDIILLDYNLPDTSGIDLLDKIIERCDVPVVFVTGNSDISSAAQAIRKGAQDYIVKLGDYLFALPIVVEKNIRLYALKQENTNLQAKLTATLEKMRLKNIALEQSMQKLQTMAATDHLTVLSNRRTFAETLDR